MYKVATSLIILRARGQSATLHTRRKTISKDIHTVTWRNNSI